MQSNNANYQDDNMKHCIKCDRLIPLEAEFCPYCGATQPPLTRSSQNQKAVDPQPDEPEQQPNKSHWYTKWYVWVLIIIIVVLGLFVFNSCSKQNGNNANDQSSSSSSSSSQSSQPQVIKDVQQKLEVVGIPSDSVSYDPDADQIKVDLPAGNAAVKAATSSQTIWNKAVKVATDATNSSPKYSNLKVSDPSGKTLLKINNGQVVTNSR